LTTSIKADALYGIIDSLGYIIPELLLIAGFVFVLLMGLVPRLRHAAITLYLAAIVTLALSCLSVSLALSNFESPTRLFSGTLRNDDYSLYFKLLFDLAGLLTFLLSIRSPELKESKHTSEYIVLILAIILGSHLLVMSTNFIVLFIAIEMISIPSYVLTGYGTGRSSAEGSLKYFLFGSVATAIMLYGFTLLYGLSGSVDFSSVEFIRLSNVGTPLMMVAGLLSLTGFLYKIAAAPLHLWAPDIYEASPIPVVALFSVVPKLAGIAALSRFALALNMFGQSPFDWQLVLVVIAIISLTIGNFSALWQNNPKRMMAYSSIAQTGFLLVGICTFSITGFQFMLFYAAVYVAGNYLVFSLLQYAGKFEIQSIDSFQGWGRNNAFNSTMMLVGLVSLAGIPPTAGFISKLFIFSGLWEAYSTSSKTILVVLLVFGLANTVVSIFYYLKIPYYAFFKASQIPTVKKEFGVENLLALILVIVVLFLFIMPDFLMGWLNRINFVL
jgi:NADH-quinone oxidoreductase subunit N